MATSFLPFPGRASNANANTNTNPWIYAGLASSFPNIEPDTSSSKSQTKIAKPPPDPWHPPPADDEPPPPCKIFENADSCLKELPLPLDEVQLSQEPNAQIIMFRYRDKIHAIDHSCPHRTYPLSRGTIFDIEDFGIILSAGITCPKHGWAFDLTTGHSDRGAYKLGVWEVETRKAENGEEQVWVRKKERKRIG